MTDEHEHAMNVAEQAYSAGNLVTCDGYYEFDLDAAAAVIAADRAGLVAEVERLVRAWEAQHKEKVKEREEARLWFEKAQKWAEENARLREALERIATVDMGGGFLGALACQKVARAALKDTRHD
ncbi:MAG: hypothetical protein KA312_01250 [Sphingorhabdus sp.]|nr:hypothetical protein [Sphingorhabdus sp.]